MSPVANTPTGTSRTYHNNTGCDRAQMTHRPKPSLPFEFCPARVQAGHSTPRFQEEEGAVPGATAGGQQRPGCALGLRPRTHSCCGGKLTAGHCCSSAGPPSVAVRQSGRHQERPSPKGGPPRHRAGARPPREQAQLSRAEGVRGAEPGVLGDTPTAAGWPIRPRFEVRGRPTAAGGSGNAGRGGGAVVDRAWTRQAGGGPLCPAPPRRQPSCSSPSA